MANKVLDKGRSEQKRTMPSGRERKRALLNHLQGHLERLERRLRAGHVGQAAHSVKSLAVGRSTTPTVFWKARRREGLHFLPFSHFLFLEGK